jgi:hypothetical protein
MCFDLLPRRRKVTKFHAVFNLFFPLVISLCLGDFVAKINS